VNTSIAQPVSLIAFWVCCSFLFLVSHFYYPKWKNEGTEATISWDVAGYYAYLPAVFIYQDLKALSFTDSILPKYRPVPDLLFAYPHGSGNYVLAYSSGQAVILSPFFFLGHLYASLSETYPADGYSRPYQVATNLGALIIAFIGLWFCRLNLLAFFSDRITATVLILLVFASNYLEYTAITGAMTHNPLFTLYALLIFLTIRFYKNPTMGKAVGIGLVVGLATLTRPTEVISALIPVLWGVKLPLVAELRGRLLFLWRQRRQLIMAALTAAAVGSIQLFYWKYVAGEWLVYSYQEQGFSWLNPHFTDGWFSYKAGWLTYSPVFFFALIGFIPMFRKWEDLFWTIAIFCSLFTYLVVSWDIWWYGGSLGNRAMIQSYPLFAFPMAASMEWIYRKKWRLALASPVFLLFIYLNLWWTHQAHKGGLFHPEEMKRAYFWKVIGTYELRPEDRKLLDTNEDPPASPHQIKALAETDFSQEQVSDPSPCLGQVREGKSYICLHAGQPQSPELFAPLGPEKGQWVRATARLRSLEKEAATWNTARLVVRFWDGGELIKEKGIRVFRFLERFDEKELFADIRSPRKNFDRVSALVTREGSVHPLIVMDLRLESYLEK